MNLPQRHSPSTDGSKATPLLSATRLFARLTWLSPPPKPAAIGGALADALVEVTGRHGLEVASESALEKGVEETVTFIKQRFISISRSF
jgi:hypothetical protein